MISLMHGKNNNRKILTYRKREQNGGYQELGVGQTERC